MKVVILFACVTFMLGVLPYVDGGITFVHPISHNITDVRCMDVKGFKSFPNDSTTYTITGYRAPSHYGRVVFIDYTYIEDFVASPIPTKHLAELAAEESQKGAVGLIVITGYNLGLLWLFTENPRDPNFPICAIDSVEFSWDAGYFFNSTFEVTQPDGTYLISATISGDHDFWIEYQSAGWNIFLTIFFCVINAAGLAFNIYKMIQFYKAELLGFNLVSICLGFLAVASILREFFLIDIRQLNGFLQFHVWRFLFYGFWPFEFIASFMVILYWFEVLTSNQIVVTTFFYRFRIPFIIICVILLVMQTIMAWVFAFPANLGFGALETLSFFFATTYIYVAVLAIIAIFNIAIGSFVINRVKQRAKIQNKSAKDISKTIRQLSNRVAGTATCYFLIIFLFVFSRTAEVATTLEFGFAYYYFLSALWIVSNFIQVMTFQVTFRSAGTRNTTRSSTRGSVSTTE